MKRGAVLNTLSQTSHDESSRLRKVGDRLTSGIIYFSAGLFIELVAASIMQLRRYLKRLSESATAELRNVKLSKIKEEDVEQQFDEIVQIREEKARLEFEFRQFGHFAEIFAKNLWPVRRSPHKNTPKE